LFYYPIYKLSHLAAIATLAGTRQLTTDIRGGGSPSYSIQSPILFSGSCIGPWLLIDICRPGIRADDDDGSLANSTPRRRVVSWPLYIRKWEIENVDQRQKKEMFKTYRERSVRIIRKYELF